MGNPLAPIIADLWIQKIEEKLNRYTTSKPMIWLRLGVALYLYLTLKNAGKYSSISEKLPCLLSTENQDDLYYIIQQQYGGVWRTFNFEDSFGDCSGESRPFLYVDGNIDLYVLSQFMAKEWKLEKPNLVVPILSAVSRYKIFKNLKMIEALKTGIRNVSI
ncbi:unnamed protein product [Rotaria socialis]|uniref:Uncharacterized protein n=1 Tax=Rotaria socialis TaxID=392032 RepID=A0A817UKJ5_9BILA|nr:unnamed protein product [Rotaria socialis]